MVDAADGGMITGEVDVVAIYFVVFITLYLPYKALKSHRQLQKSGGAVTRTQLVLSTFLLQSILVLFAWIVANSNAIELWPKTWPNLGGIGAGVALLAVCAGTLPLRMKYVRAAKSTTLWPTSSRDLPLWIVLSFVAGIGEELVYRGVLTEVLRRWSGDITLAVVGSALAFGVAHILQGWKLALFVFLIALGLQGVVIASGCLYVAMAVHVLYDVIAGVYYARKL